MIRLSFLTFLLLCCHIASAQLVVDFTASQQEGCGSFQVTFTNISTLDGSNIDLSDYSCTWNFGATSCSPSLIFNDIGTHTVCLTITDSQGNSTETCKEDYITVYSNPDIDFEANSLGSCAPLNVELCDISTSPNGNIVERLWNVNGITNTDSCFQISLNEVGLYSPFLQIKDDKNCIATLRIDDYLEVYSTPSVDFGVSDSFSCQPPFNVIFTNETTNADAGTTYEWYFQGAGNIVFYGGANPPEITYVREGKFDVTLIAINNQTGCADTLQRDGLIAIGDFVRFDADKWEVCLGDSIQFTDLSSGSPSSWNWDFGNGTISTAQNPLITYSDLGSYTVSLTVESEGCTNSYTSPIQVNVIPQLTGSLNIDNQRGCTLPHRFDFQATSNDNISEWEWMLDVNGNSQSGSSSMANNIEINEFGKHLLTVTARNAIGCELVLTDTIYVEALEALLDDNLIQGCVPLSATLEDASYSVVPIQNWEWTVNGQTYNEPRPTIVFQNEADTGVYDVKLVVENQLGCIDSIEFVGKIEVGIPPEIEFQGDPREACIEDLIDFIDMSSTYSDAWFWDFGDGGTSTEQFPRYKYQDTGFFTVCLTSFHNGCQNFLCKEDYIYIQEPKARYKLERNCDNTYEIDIADNSIGADTVVYQFCRLEVIIDSTDINDIKIDTTEQLIETIPDTRNLTYTFQDTGLYRVKQWVKSFETLCEDNTRKNLYITDPEANFDFDTLFGCVPLTLIPNDLSLFAVEWKWFATDTSIFSNSSIQSPVMTFDTSGIYTGIGLTITDVNGCGDTYIFPDPIRVNEVFPEYTYAPVTGCTPLPVTFTDQSTNLFGTNVAWFWDFGDDSTSVEQSPIHIFTISDSIDVELTVTDEFGCEASILKEDIITPTFPFVDFEYDTVACTLQSMRFRNRTTAIGASYQWYFGDGAMSTERNPRHSYDEEGFYSVCLLATDINGCVDSTCHTIRIANPIADFEYAPEYAACPPLVETFTNLSINTNPDENLWFFGDGNTSDLENPVHVYSEPGIYSVTLIATGYSGCKDTLQLDSIIRIDGPVGDFRFALNQGCVPFADTFYTESLLPAYHYLAYNNETIDSSTALVTKDTFIFIYTKLQDVLPKLILEDAGGCKRTLTRDSIFAEDITIDFINDKNIICQGGQIEFTNFSSSTIPIDSVRWEFPGGTPTTSTERDPIVFYNANGEYDVTLTVYNALCSKTEIKQNLIRVDAQPQAAYSLQPDSGCSPLLVSFIDESMIEYGNVTGWKWDFGNDSTATVSNPIIQYTEGTYETSLIVASPNFACFDTTYRTLVVDPTPEAIPGPDKTICINEEVALDVEIVSLQGDLTYEWTPDTGLSCSDCLIPIASPTSTTTYQLRVTNEFDCFDLATITVNVIPHPVPEIMLLDTTAVCASGSVQLEALVTNTSVESYHWQDTSTIETITCKNCPNPFVSPDVTTSYFLEVIGAGGCPALDTITILVTNEFGDFVGPNKAICLGSETEIRAPEGLGSNPRWIPSTGLNCEYCPVAIASPQQTTTYTLELDLNGCKIRDTILITVLRQEDIDAGEHGGVCLGQSTQLEGRGIGDITWSPATFLSDVKVLNPIVTNPTETMSYTMTIQFDECILEDNVEVVVRTSAEVEASAEPVCLGNDVQINTVGVAERYEWTPITGLSDPTAPNPVATITETTLYTVTAHLNNCTSSTAEVEAIVNYPPELKMYPVKPYFSGQQVQLEVEALTGSGNYQYDWMPSDDLSCNDCPNPTVVPDTNSLYFVHVLDLDTGCEADAEVRLEGRQACSNDFIKIPNGFSPNGDGENDVLFVRGAGFSEIEVFRVFNRWGELVFETKDINTGWDGMHQGEIVNPGVYVYYIEAPCLLDGSKLLKKGNVTVLR